MIDISVAFAAWLANAASTPAYCLALTRKDGTTVRGTSWQTSLTVDGELYVATSGAEVSNIEHESGLTVANSEVLVNFGQVTAAHLKAGIYAGAGYEFFMVNPADLTMGRFNLMGPSEIGAFALDRLTWKAELRGLLQALQQSVGRVCLPTCPYETFDDDCGLDVADFTETGTLGSVTADQMTFTDAARAEAGPAGAIAIVSMSRGNPTVLTLASALGVQNGAAVVLSDLVGPIALAGTISVQNVDDSAKTFEININTTSTTDYPNLTSGKVTVMGADAGFFDYGLMRLTSGANALPGIAREVKGYVNNGVAQWSVQEPFPYAVAGTETYSLTWGDDHTFATCKTKFGNGPRHGGMPDVPGQDSVAQVGRRD